MATQSIEEEVTDELLQQDESQQQPEASDITPDDMTEEIKKALTPRKPSQRRTEEEEDTQSAGKETGDDQEGENLKDEIAALAELHGVDARLLKNCESVEEAEAACEAVWRSMYDRNHGAPQESAPSPGKPDETQKTAKDEELDFDPEDFDEDSPARKYFEKLIKQQKKLEERLADAELRSQEAMDQEYGRVRQQAAIQFQSTLMRMQPELFGTPDKQTYRQKLNFAKAYQAGQVLDSGSRASASVRPIETLDELADKVLRLEFGTEVAKAKSLASTKANGKRTQRRLGTPSGGRSIASQEKTKPFEGPADEDPSILRAVEESLARIREGG